MTTELLRDVALFNISGILLREVCARLRQTNDRLVHSMFRAKQ